MWNDWKEGVVYPDKGLFYAGWTTDAASLYIEMDNELQRLLRLLPVSEGCVPTVLDYYESHDAESLACKLRSIPAFKSILSPMKQVPGGYVPDFGSRYFTEDFPYGLGIICQLAESKKLPVPVMDRVFAWGMEMIRKYTGA